MNGEIQEMLKVLKQVRNLLLTQFLTSLAADREFATNWLYSDDISIDTGDIPPTTAIQINFPVPEGKINTAEKIKWKLDEWWTTNIEWYRDGVKVYEENNAVDGETNVRIIPARDLTSVNITNTSTTTSVKVKIRWHYAFADRAIYETFITGIFKEATDIIKEIAGIEGEFEGAGEE